ncbi:hypothetical protein KKC13_02955 [bacterium]|nr:hypothetical protein [bacterium]MBU1959524.1 hypothetical protein [bacterium]
MKNLLLISFIPLLLSTGCTKESYKAIYNNPKQLEGSLTTHPSENEQRYIQEQRHHYEHPVNRPSYEEYMNSGTD